MTARPLRVLTVTPDYPPLMGGIQLLVNRVLQHAERIESRVVTITPGGMNGTDSAVGDVRRAPHVPDHRAAVLLMNSLAIREARRYRPDVVLSAHIVASPAAAAITRLLRVPSVLYVYGKEVGASPRVARFAMRTSTQIIAISRYARSLGLRAGADEDRVTIIPPGVDLFDPEPRERCPEPTILTVARLEDRYKGHDMIIRALPLIRAQIPDVQWVVIGNGQLRAEILELAKANGVDDSVRLLGGVPDAERNDWLDRAHVFAMPSRLPAGKAAGEGFGIVYLEAGVHRLPVVAGNVGGALDAVVDGQTGLLVDPTSSVALAGAISDLLTDRARAQAMGEAGYRFAQEFAWPHIAAQVEDVLLDVSGRL